MFIDHAYWVTKCVKLVCKCFSFAHGDVTRGVVLKACVTKNKQHLTGLDAIRLTFVARLSGATMVDN